MNNLKNILRGNLRKYMMLIILVVIAVFFGITTKGVLFLPMNITNLVTQNAYVIILAVGMMMCIITGGNVDLSIGSVLGFVGALLGVLMVGKGMNTWLVIAICFGVALIAGVWNGFWIAYFSVPSFIATLSGMLSFRGLTYRLLNGKTYYSFPPEFLSLTTGSIPDFLNDGSVPLHLTTMVIGAAIVLAYVLIALIRRGNQKKSGINVEKGIVFAIKVVLLSAVILEFSYLLAQHKGIPTVLIPVAVIVIVYSFIMGNTSFGRHVYALGGNQKAAQLSGINVKKVMFFVYVNMALLSAIAGMIYTARMNSASPKAGDGFEMDAIASSYIGGASASGGIGTIAGAMIGALVMGVLNNGMSIMGVDAYTQMIVKGLVLLLAVVLDLIQKNRNC